eukprot:s3857_g3.t1
MAGSLLVFDELLNFPYFEREELRAFYEFLRQHRWKYRIVHAPWPAARDRGRCIGWALPDDELTAEASDAVLLGFAPPEARGYGVDAATTAAPKVGPEPKAEALKFNSSMASSALAPNALCGADYRRGDPRRQFLKAILTDLESLDGTEIRGRISFRAPQWLPDPTGIGHGRWLVPRDNPQSPGRVSLALVDPETNEAEIVCETLPPEAHFTATPSWVAWLEAQMSRDSDGECWYISDLVMTSSNITPSSSHDAHRDGPVTSSGTVKRFLSYRMTGDYTYAYGLQGTSWQEHLNCQDAGDELGEALSLLSLAHAYMELSKPKEVLSSADAARKLFRSLGDKMGELSALQITADVHARAMRYSEMAQALEKALSLAEVLGDNVTEASLQISFAQAQMGLLEVSSAAPGTDTFRDLGNSSAKAAKKAVALARRQQRSDLVISALCAYSQTQFLVGEKQAARSAAKAAVSLAKGQPLSQANALVLTANSCITLGKMQAAKEAAGNALYLFEEVKDYVGQDLAKATLDAIDNPVSAVSTTGKMRLVRKKKSSVNADALRQKVRNVVSEIVGMDALQDDTPLMQSGLTSQSAVLLRNALSTEIPGSSLPFTLMFDYPSISDLSAFFVESAGGEEEEVEEWVEDPSAGRQVAQARSGPSPDELRKQVRDVVAEIVGMDDLVDDTPLMQAGLTSQSAVLLRNSLSKELPGAS